MSITYSVDTLKNVGFSIKFIAQIKLGLHR